jgi:predicted dehydrogenase
MKVQMNRRKFLGTAVASGAFSIIPRHTIGGPGFVAPSDKITLAYIGIGTQGIRELLEMIPIPEIQVVAVCDPEKDSNRYVEFTKGDVVGRIRKFLGKPNWRSGITAAPGGRMVGKEIVETYYAERRAADHFSGVTPYSDFRELLDKEKDLNAVKVMTPDHLHATIAIVAMRKGIHVATHKPIANRMNEARMVFDTAQETKRATYLLAYNSPRGADVPRIKAWIDGGAIGTLREIHLWTSRPMWPQFETVPAEQPAIPQDFDWQMWLGPSVDRPYHPNYTHTLFRGWYEFGGGSLADIGIYAIWPIITAFNLGTPVRIEPVFSTSYAVSDELCARVRNEVSFPDACSVRFKMPASAGRFVDLFWYDGGMKPQRPGELEEDDEELAREGSLYIGDKGKIITGAGQNTQGNARIIPRSRMRAYAGPEPPPSVPRTGGLSGPQALADWLGACKGGPQSGGNFLKARVITDLANLGAVALRAGRTIHYDPVTMKVTNPSDANRHFGREYRKGWELS